MMNRTHALATLLASTAALGIVSHAHAAGVAAGTLIENTATATFGTGATTGSVQSNKVTVRVDELLDVAVASLTTSPASASASAAMLTYSVTNSGNGTEAFALTADAAVSGNAFNGTIDSIVVDSNGNGTYDAGVDTVISNGGASAAVGADASFRVFVFVQLPSGATDAQTSQVRLSASAVTGTGSAGTIIAGGGDGGVDAVVGATTAQSNALASLIASLASVSLTKSAAIADPFGGSTPVPGATVTYTLLAKATGSGTATGVRIADVIPAGTTYQAGSITLDGSALTDAADSDAGTGGASGIDVLVGDMAGGSPDRTVSFKVKIN